MALTQIDDRGLKTPIDLLDNEKIRLGTGNDLELYHDGSNSYMGNSTGYLYLKSDYLALRSASSENYIIAESNGAVQLYYDNSKKLETTNTGVTVTGRLEATSGIRGNDNVLLQLGTANDLVLSHDGSNSKIHHGGAGGLKVTCDDFQVQKNDGSEWIMRGQADGAVELYYDNSKKLETISNGCTITGRLNVTDTVNPVQINLTDTRKIKFGDSDDLQIYHDGSNSRINNTHTGTFLFDTAGELQLRSTSTKKFIRAIQDGAIELFHNNSKKFETTANGVTVDGSNSISMDGNANGQLQVIGSGYTGAIALNSSAMHIYHNSDARDLVFGINETERLRLTTGGELKFATGSRSGNVNSICAANGNSIDLNGSEYMYFRTGNSERARIDSNGHFLVHATSNSSTSDTGFKILDWGGYGTWVAHVYNSPYPANTPGPHLYNLNNSYSGVRFYPRVDGGLANYQSNNANLCDERAKTDIVDLGDQWSTVKQWKVRKFRYKKDPSDTPLKVGVIAQQIENVSPDLVEEDWPYEGEPNNPTTLYKTVKEEQMFMIAMKALQEAMAKIETLETKVAALEAA